MVLLGGWVGWVGLVGLGCSFLELVWWVDGWMLFPFLVYWRSAQNFIDDDGCTSKGSYAAGVDDVFDGCWTPFEGGWKD